jgi:hypothetical protein
MSRQIYEQKQYRDKMAVWFNKSFLGSKFPLLLQVRVKFRYCERRGCSFWRR